MLEAEEEIETETPACLSEARKFADARAAFGDDWNGSSHADQLRGQRLYVSAMVQGRMARVSSPTSLRR